MSRIATKYRIYSKRFLEKKKLLKPKSKIIAKITFNYINEISEVLNEIADGNLCFTLKQEYHGEFGRLKAALLHISDSLSQTLKDIQNASSQVTDGANQLSYGAQSLAEGATEQAGAIEELQATIETISNQLKESAEQSHEVEIGNQLTAQTAASLASVTEGLNTVVVLSDSTYRASEDQARSIIGIESGITQISAVVQNNSAAAQQSSATSEQLSAQASLLNELIDRFKISD